MSRPVINVFGQTIGELLIMKRLPGQGSARWLCLCSCGNETIKRNRYLLRYSVFPKSCGCINISGTLTHGQAKRNNLTVKYKAWRKMHGRCNDLRNKYYGGRGIKVCKRWSKFETFDTDMPDHPGKGYSLDRKNVNGNYCKANCKWSTQSEQVRNRRPNLKL